jgi:hypothetical protein
LHRIKASIVTNSFTLILLNPDVDVQVHILLYHHASQNSWTVFHLLLVVISFQHKDFSAMMIWYDDMKQWRNTMKNALTEHKVVELVFESKSWSAFAKLCISCAIEGYLDPLDMSTCKQTNTHSFCEKYSIFLYNIYDCSWWNSWKKTK